MTLPGRAANNAAGDMEPGFELIMLCVMCEWDLLLLFRYYVQDVKYVRPSAARTHVSDGHPTTHEAAARTGWTA